MERKLTMKERGGSWILPWPNTMENVRTTARELRAEGWTVTIEKTVGATYVWTNAPMRPVVAEGKTAQNREPVPCESDEHVFRPEAYELPAGEPALHDECCTICGWSWDEIADHDRGDCCCPADHTTKPLESG